MSYRLTPRIAEFVNAFWGTEIIGGNTQSENLPVEYFCRNPYPGRKTEKHKLPTQLLADLVDEYGPEHVLLLAQSVKHEQCPIRVPSPANGLFWASCVTHIDMFSQVHVNEMMQMQTADGRNKYNFHVKESDRGFTESNVSNKVRVWTFCGSKGCEAKVVVVFGCSLY